MVAARRDIASYENAELIGQGGFGAVYRAVDAVHGRDVAIKVLPSWLDEKGRRRFDRERETMGLLGAHPNVMPVHDSGYTTDDEPYIVMDLATGGSLQDRLASGRLEWLEAVAVIVPIAAATQAAHDRGVVHRDIKPDNILIDAFGTPKLTDFGVAAVASNVTNTASTAATVAHAAPEQLLGHATTPAVDVYALGSTLHTLLTGSAPFTRLDDEAIGAIVTRVLNDPPPDLRPYGVPESVVVAIERALAKEPEQRQPSAAALAEQLATAAGMTFDAMRPPVGASISGPTVVAGTPLGAADSGGAVARIVDSSRTGDHGGAPPVPTGRGAEQGRRWGLIAGIGGSAALVLAVGIGALAATGGGGTTTSTSVETTTTTASTTTSTTSTTVAVVIPRVSIDCPDEIAVGELVTCFIDTEEASLGQWNLPGFMSSPLPIETVPGRSEIDISPNNPDVIGEVFTLQAMVVGADGQEAEVEHNFTVVGPTVMIECPDRIARGDSVTCVIVSDRVTEGEWEIPGFGSGALEAAPGRSLITISPNTQVPVGTVFTITVTARIEDREITTSQDFTIAPAN